MAENWLDLAPCVDHLIVLGEVHLRRKLCEFAAYYDQTREAGFGSCLNVDAVFFSTIAAT